MSNLGPRQQALVNALRSGKYHKAVSQLRLDARFCCLGVACDISGLGKWIDNEFISAGEIRTGGLPMTVQAYFAFNGDMGYFIKPEGETPNSLAAVNDAGASFAEIADLIEAKSSNLFKEPK